MFTCTVAPVTFETFEQILPLTLEANGWCGPLVFLNSPLGTLAMGFFGHKAHKGLVKFILQVFVETAELR